MARANSAADLYFCIRILKKQNSFKVNHFISVSFHILNMFSYAHRPTQKNETDEFRQLKFVSRGYNPDPSLDDFRRRRKTSAAKPTVEFVSAINAQVLISNIVNIFAHHVSVLGSQHQRHSYNGPNLI